MFLNLVLKVEVDVTRDLGMKIKSFSVPVNPDRFRKGVNVFNS